MRKAISLITLCFLFTTLAIATGGTEAEVPKTPVKFGIQSLKIGNQNLLALNYENAPHWHTYWKNPGDAGLPIKAKISINGKETQLEALEWPIPQRFIEKGDILAYGYEGKYSLFYKLPKGTTGNIEVLSNWLVCRHVCIPGEASASGNIKDNKLKSANSLNFSSNTLNKHYRSLPTLTEFPEDLDLVLAKASNKDTPTLTLFYNLSNVADKVSKKMNILTPYPTSPFSFKREKLYKDSKNNVYARFDVEWDGEYMEPVIPFPTNGKFQRPYKLKFLYTNPKTQQTSIIEKAFSTISLDKAEKTESFFSLVTEIKPDDKSLVAKTQASKKESKSATPVKEERSSLLYYLIFAFIGGFILNFMPCVLPVISLKLFGLIRHSSEGRMSILKHNVFYSLGVLFTFAILAGIVVAIKSAGSNIGWGFQLQSPLFVAIMALVIFLMALNLFGLFEFKTPGGSKLGNIEIRNTYSGDFIGGILATILSTPCSAPFLGTALTFAFSSDLLTISLVFLSIGLGLSFPFLLTGFFPSLISFLPRPGAWMEHLKKFLGLTLILTVVWLLDVYTALVSSSLPVIKLNTSLVLIFFSFYMYKYITKKKRFLFPFYLLSIIFFSNTVFSVGTSLPSTSSEGLLKDKQTSGLNWIKWSEKAMNDLQDQKKITFVDFTAKWCFTCKVNEKLVIETEAFKKLIKETGATLLLADWTRRDEEIGKWLKSQGLVGVPAYFIINSNGELINLGETISMGEIKLNLK